MDPELLGRRRHLRRAAVTAVVPDAAKPFLTMTPRDLAAGLSQAASAVLGMQNAKDGDLPLMRGSIANAVDAVGGIKAFLADQVPDADPDDDTPGSRSSPRCRTCSQPSTRRRTQAPAGPSTFSVATDAPPGRAPSTRVEEGRNFTAPHHPRRRERPRAERPRRRHDRNGHHLQCHRAGRHRRGLHRVARHLRRGPRGPQGDRRAVLRHRRVHHRPQPR